MQDSVYQILYLGETPAWSRLSQALLDAPGSPLRLRRVDSLAELFHALIVGNWHAVAIDVHAWNFRGLHFVDKLRSEYPNFPMIAVHSGAIPDLDKKAITSGASLCMALDDLTANSLHASIAKILEDTKSIPLLGKSAKATVSLDSTNGVAVTFSKNQVITHALNNLLCVIAANADLLTDKLMASPEAISAGLTPDVRPLSEIKKAARSAAALMRHLK
jgi:hypothetical protein